MTNIILQAGMLATELDWRAAALCAQVDPELHFPEKGGNAEPAKAVCRSCPSRLPCLSYAVPRYDEGVWGGFSARQREAIRRKLRAGKPLEVIIAEDDEKVRVRQETSRRLRLAAAARKRNAERALSGQRATALGIAS